MFGPVGRGEIVGLRRITVIGEDERSMERVVRPVSSEKIDRNYCFADRQPVRLFALSDSSTESPGLSQSGFDTSLRLHFGTVPNDSIPP